MSFLSHLLCSYSAIQLLSALRCAHRSMSIHLLSPSPATGPCPGMQTDPCECLPRWMFMKSSPLRELCPSYPLLIVQPTASAMQSPDLFLLPPSTHACSFPKQSQPYSLAPKTLNHHLSPFIWLISCLSYSSLCHHFPPLLDASSFTPSQVAF